MWSKRGDTTLVLISFLVVLLASAVYVYSQNETSNQTVINQTSDITITLNSTIENISDSSVPNQEVSPTPHEELPVQVLNETAEITSIKIRDHKGKESDAELKKVKKEDKDRLEVLPSKGAVKKLEFSDLNLENSGSLGIDEVPNNKDKSKKWEQVYAIDPTNLDFTNATVTASAKGNQLYKCKEWDFTNQVCNGQWVFLQSVTPGQDYTFVLTQDDPGFGEILATEAIHMDENYTIISDIFDKVKTKDDVWSEPIYEGEIVRVTFEEDLTDGRFIDVYVRSNGTTAYFDVYEAGTDHKVGRSGTTDPAELQYIEVTGLTAPTDTFDFKVVKVYADPGEEEFRTLNSSLRSFLEFDFIHDDAINSTAAKGLIVYNELNIAAGRYRLYSNTTNAFDAELTGPSIGTGGTDDAAWVVTKGIHERDQIIVGIEDKSLDVNIMIFNRTKKFSNLQEVAIAVPNAALRAFDIAVEDVSGDALIFYENDTGTDNGNIFYRVWDGTTYSAQQTVVTPLSAVDNIAWISATSRPRTDQILVLIHNAANNDLAALFWNGTGFDPKKNLTLNIATPTNTQQHFAFEWEQSNGEGIAVYGAGNNLAYRNFSATSATPWSTNGSIMGLGNALQGVRLCPDPKSDFIGIIVKDAGDDVNVRMWNGTTILASPPTEDALTEPSGVNNPNVACAWEATGRHGLFGFVDNNGRGIDYFNFTKPDTWSVTALTGALATDNIGSDDVGGLRFTSHPTTNEIMAVVLDIVEDINASRWTGTTFVTTSSPGNIETSTEVLNGDQEGAMFDWYRYDTIPEVKHPRPTTGSTFNVSQSITISANVTDNVAVSQVNANITRPNGVTTSLNLVLDGGSKYNKTFTIPNITGTYTVRFIANDTSTHKNINKSVTITFTAVDLIKPAVFDVKPLAGSTFNISQTITIAANATDNINVSRVRANITFPNGSRQIITLTRFGTTNKYNRTFTIPAVTGNYVVRFIANDTSNNVNNTVSTNFNAVENIKPAVFDVKPLANSVKNVSSVITIAANVTDNAAVSRVRANITFPNGSRQMLILTKFGATNKYNKTFSVPNITGVYIIRFIANDTSNNVNNTVRTNFTAQDRTRPAVFDVKPLANSVKNVSTVITISANVTDNIAVGIVRANITFPNGSRQIITLTQNGAIPGGNKYNRTFTIPNVTGLYVIRFIANDTANNLNRTVFTNFTAQDRTKPAVFDLRPINATTFSLGTKIEIAANATDNVAVSVVRANITFPNGSRLVLTLPRITGNAQKGKYNNSFTIPTNQKGAYVVRFIANDTSNNVNNTVRTIFIANDTTKPAVFDVKPIANSIFNISQVITIAANVTDNVAVSVVRANITMPNGSRQILTLTKFGATNKYNKTFTIPNNQKGLYVVRFIANDTSNNLNRTVFTNFTARDNVKPAVFDMFPRNASIFNITNLITIAVNVTDSVGASKVKANLSRPGGLGFLQINLVKDGATDRYNSTFRIPNATGLYNITFDANDTSNNHNTSRRVQFRANDRTKPAVFDLRPINATNYNVGTAIEIAANATDSIGVDRVRANITFPNGSRVLLTLPRVIGNALNGKYNTSFTIPTNQKGAYTVRFIANDTSNNVNNTVKTIFIANDNVKPSVFDVKPPANSVKNVSTTITIAANVTDNIAVSVVRANITFPNGSRQMLTLVQNGGAKFNRTFTVPNVTGVYIIRFIANDTSNNVNNTVRTNFTAQDRMRPEVRIILPPPSSVFNTGANVTIKANVSDNIAVSRVRANITFPNGSTIGKTLTFTGGISYNTTFNQTAINGLYTIRILANDTANNKNQTVTRTFTIQDANNPVVHLISPADNTFTRNNNITFTCNATDNVALQNISLYHNIGQAFGRNKTNVITGTFNVSNFNLTNVADGTYKWNCRAYDTSGNTAFGQSNFTITKDRTPPAVFSPRPIANSVKNVSTRIEIAVNASDVNNVNRVKANITFPNGSIQLKTLALVLGTASNGKYNVSFSIPNVTGLYSIRFFANDTLNNINRTTTTNFTAVDNVKPAVFDVKPIANSLFNISQVITIAANVTDNIAVSVVRANITFPNGTLQLLVLTKFGATNKYNKTFTVPNNQKGLYRIQFIANDTSNNVNRTVRTNFTAVDNVRPAVIDVRPINATNYNIGTAIEIAANVTDSVAVSVVKANITFPNGSRVLLSLPIVSGNAQNGKYNTSFTIPINQKGAYTVRFIANDTSNNVNRTVKTIFIANDNRKPEVTDGRPPGSSFNISTTIQISANVTDTVSVSKVRANITFPNGTRQLLNLFLNGGTKYNNTFTIPTNQKGLYRIQFIANDTSNNVNNTVRANFTALDNVKPAVFDVRPVNSTNYNVGTAIEIAANVTNINVSTVRANITFPNGSRVMLTLPRVIGNAQNGKYNTSFTIPTNQRGAYTVRFIANDTSNNVNRTVKTIFIANDATKPAVFDFKPVANSVKNVSAKIEIAVNATDNINVSVVRANITFPNGSRQLRTLTRVIGTSLNGRYNVSFSIPNITGLYVIRFIANDSSNNVNNTVFTNFTAQDRTNPEVKNVRPIAGSTFNISRLVTISANVTDNIAVSRVRANITFPNSSRQIITLTKFGSTNKYNRTFRIPNVTGLYTVRFIANDTSNNLNRTIFTNFTAIDVTSPVITPLTCRPGDGNLSNSVLCNATVTDDIAVDRVRANVTIPGIGTQKQTVGNISNVYFFTFTNTTRIGRFNVTWFANDTSNNRATATDDFNVSDRIKPTLVLNAPPNDFNTSNRKVTFNFTTTDNFDTTINCSLNIDGTITNTTIAINNTPKLLRKSGHSEGNHTWFVSCRDDSGNTNTSSTRKYKVDVSAPRFISLTTQPSSADDLDPGRNITVLAEVADNVTGVQQVILQRKLSNQSLYINKTMTLNTTSGVYYAVFNATTAGTYNLRLNARDVVNNSRNSNIVNISVVFEKTWARSPSAFDPVTTTANQNVTLGVLNITNTGDVTLNFSIRSNFNTTKFNQSVNFSLARGFSRFIEVNDTAPSAGVKSITLNITARPNATPNSRITTGSIVVAQQPILLVKFIQPSTDLITKQRGSTNIPIEVNLTNIGAKNATNVTLFITFPSGFTLTFGSNPLTVGDLLVDQSVIHNLEFSITSNHALGIFTVVGNATGQNETGGDLTSQGLIFEDEFDVNVTPQIVLQPSGGGGGAAPPVVSSGGGGGGGSVAQVPGTETIFTDEVVAVVRGTEEGIPIKITNFYENSVFQNIDLSVLGFFSQYVRIVSSIDYTKEVFVETLNVPLNAFGQRVNVILGGDIGQHTIEVSDITQDSITFIFFSDPITVSLKIGETKKYDIDGDGTNDVAFTLKNIILGKADLKVHRIGPPDPSRLYYLEDRDYIMTIFAPAYLTQTDFNLTVKIAADIIAVNPELAGFDAKKLIEYRRFLFKVLEAGKEEVTASIDQAEKDIQEMEAAGFPTARTRDLLDRAKIALANQEPGEALVLVDEIRAAKINAFEANSLINEIKTGIESAKVNGLSVIQTENSLALAVKAFEREDFSTAVQRAKETQLALILETKGRINIILFLRDYWWAVIIGTAGAIIVGFVVYRKLEIFFIELKLANLDKEETSIKSLIEEAQRKRMKEGGLSGEDYSRILKQYDTRLNNIRQQRIISRNKRLILLQSKKGIEILNKEQKQIAGLMKKAQDDYFNRGKITREKFLDVYKSDKEKLAEVQEEKQKLLEKMHKQKLIEKIAKKQERERRPIEIHEALQKPELPRKEKIEEVPAKKHRFLIFGKIKRLFIRNVDEEIKDLTYEIENKMERLKKEGGKNK